MARLNSFLALIRRNFIYRKRNIIGSLFEVISPALLIFVMVIVKVSLHDKKNFTPVVVPPSASTNQEAIIPYSFNDYVTAIQAKRVCIPETNPFNANPWAITGISNQGLDWHVPFVKCDSRACFTAGDDAAAKYCEYQILAVAPTNTSDTIGAAHAAAFAEFTYNKYPALVNNKPFDYDFIRIFESNQEIEDYVKSRDYGTTNFPKIGLAVIFSEGSSAKDYVYSLRVNSTNFNSAENAGRSSVATTPPTKVNFNNLANTDNSCPLLDGTSVLGTKEDSCTYQYLFNGLLVIQRLVDDWIIDHSGAAARGYNVAEHGVQFVPFPSKQYIKIGFYAAIADFLPLLVVLGFLYPVACVIRSITLEKQLKQKELMKMMSVTESDIGWSWFCSYTLYYFITTLVLAGATSALYSNSSIGILWIFWLLVMIAVIAFCMFMASLFTKATTATLVGLLVTIVGFFATLAADFQTGSPSLISLVSILPMGAVAYGLQEIGRLEDAGIGLRASTIGSSDNSSGFVFLSAMRSLAFDCVFWGILTWYFNRVIHSDYGQPLPFYFPFTSAYWCPGRRVGLADSGDDREIIHDKGVPVEPVTDALRAQTLKGDGIEIRGLRKQFGDRAAVDGLSLSIYKNQITALLGHNGAGKTTTISMLTGMISPTEGHAIIAGKDIRTQMSQIRENIGICLQHDCLFPDLTVEEHLAFFNRLKGAYTKYSKNEIKEKIKTAMDDVALYEKRNTLSKNLSGGMKRKLSVAIAFCGDSKTVLLDEPTSGMDPFSRRFTWNVIRQYRQDRCIILTTHFMDEADILGDRIAIMASGQLRCAGSSLFLKKHYGVGYQLTIEKPSKAIGSSNHDPREKKYDHLREIVTNAVKEASLLSSVGTELSFQLPIGAAASFKSMFEALDEEVDKKTIVTYGVSITTLDEVFLLVARGDAGEKTELQSSKLILASGDAGRVEDKSYRSRMDLEKEGLFSRHFQALFQKRVLNFKRDKKAWVCTFIIPTVTVLIGLLMFTFIYPDRNLSALNLRPEVLNEGLNYSPRNPIPFNEADSAKFTCQPGFCAGTSLFNVEETDEIYSFCGAPYFGQAIANYSCGQDYCGPLCPIADSNRIMGRIDVSQGIGISVNDLTYIKETSSNLVTTSKSFLSSQYGALHFTHDTSSTDYYDDVIANCQSAAESENYFNASFCAYLQGIGYVINYNYTALHVTPIYQALGDEAIIREALDDNSYKITAQLHPLPITAVENALGEAEDAFFAWFLLVFSFPFIAGAFGSFIVAERESKAKHLQTVAGVQVSAYWLSSYCWDIMNYQIPCWLTVFLMFAFSVDVFTTTARGVLGGVIVTLVLFGPASVGFTYCVSFAFSTPSMCNLFIIIFNFLIGLAGPLVAFILRLIGKDPSDPSPSLVLAANIMEWVLRFTPSFNWGSALFKCISIENYEILAMIDITVWHHSAILYEGIMQAILCVVYIALAILIDRWSSNPQVINNWRAFVRFILCRCHGSGGRGTEFVQDAIPADDDVIAEQERVLAGEANSDLIVLNQMTKQYDTGKLAVNNLSLGIPPGQCFGLLGINGAGKTTTMGMLTAEFPPTKGDAILAGFSVTNEPEKTRRRIGYCPQFDAHFSNMTGREHVALYAAIKGVPRGMVKEAVKFKLAEVGLSEEDSDRLSAGYSGGMKRKLSLACATIGQPQIVFLDEVSTGMDPVARRDMWGVISEMVSGGDLPDDERTSVILTTHSMAECEALCPRIGIMAAGQLQCLGSAQHLKTRFGQGYQVEIKLEDVDAHHQDFMSIMVRIAESAGVITSDTETASYDDVFLNLEQVQTALQALTGDESLSSKISLDDPTGHMVFCHAISLARAPLFEVAYFCTAEMRIAKLEQFFESNFMLSFLRERQDNKVRYEVGSEGTRISTIFAKIEENKAELWCANYGVSQTSLEQVFNMHAAKAEKLKQGGDDH